MAQTLFLVLVIMMSVAALHCNTIHSTCRNTPRTPAAHQAPSALKVYTPAVGLDEALLRLLLFLRLLLLQRGHDVWGCYMSPVADAYGKQGLAPVSHRLHMCSLAAAGTDNVMVDTWEATRPGYTRTLQVGRGRRKCRATNFSAL
jgi:hypothetical protein